MTSLDDILEQKIGLGYLLQFLISKNQEALIRFWLDVTSFIEVSRYQKSYNQVKNKNENYQNSLNNYYLQQNQCQFYINDIIN